MAKSKEVVEVNDYTVTSGASEAPKTNKYGGPRKWSVPSKRAKGYAEERKAKVHKWGQKEGKELTDYESGIRSGYLQAQSDHAGLFRYKKALDAGLSKEEAVKFSRERGTTLANKS